MKEKSILVSGIQPTNNLTLGNYLGAIKKIKKYQDKYEIFLFVADLHAITIPLTFHKFNYQEISDFRLEIVKIYIASGIDISKVKIFYQSDVSEHLKLFYLLLTHCGLGELKRMTQFKDLSKKFKEPNGTEIELMGLLVYPVLMAADILIYDADVVAVGDDQVQHLELTRNIAEKMNKKYRKKLFNLPNMLSNSDEDNAGNKIRDLQNPEKKMSKSSENHNGTIFLNDSPETIREKIMKAKTDSYNKINLDPENQMGIYNLLSIYAAINEISLKKAHEKFKDLTYLDLKKNVAECVISELGKIEKNYKNINVEELKIKLEENTLFCKKIASKKIKNIYSGL